MERDVDCSWPQPKRRRHERQNEEANSNRFSTPQLIDGAEEMGQAIDFGVWPALSDTDLNVSLHNELITYMLPLTVPLTDSIAGNPVYHSKEISGKSSKPWFLQDETWVRQGKNQEPACTTVASLEPFLQAVREMLYSWVSNGHSSMIHSRLYEYGMPVSLQDAFTTVAAYKSATKIMTPTILHIADERANSLAMSGIPTGLGASELLLHLAHIQALFSYVFIRLFDGSIRHRASAESQLPTLRQWVTQTCELAKKHQEDDNWFSADILGWEATQFDREYEASSKMWRLWILTESIRRTQVIVDTVINIYQLMVQGWSDCSGAVMLTARRGLWEADTAATWLSLSREKTPLLVPSMQPGKYLSEYHASEFDDFIHMLWRFIAGPDKIVYWIEKSGNIPV